MSLVIFGILFTGIMAIPLYNSLTINDTNQFYLDFSILLIGWAMLVLLFYFFAS